MCIFHLFNVVYHHYFHPQLFFFTFGLIIFLKLSSSIYKHMKQ